MKKILYILLFVPFLFVASCEDNEIKGCVDYNACNYNTSATSDDGSCEYTEQGYDCDGNIIAEIGDEFQGGILFYLDETGEHGLISAFEDLGLYSWCNCCASNGGAGVSIGTGMQNSLTISEDCGEGIAASTALGYEGEGYNDWYLPSVDELIEMYNTIGNGGLQGNIGGFETVFANGYYYWSSSEYTEYFAFGINFSTGGISNSINKDTSCRVRPIRSF